MQISEELIEYIKHMESLSEKLSKEDKDKLENIFTVLLQLLVSFKISSNLGKTYINFK